MGLFSSSEFDELNHLVEKATSEYIPAAQEDLALNLEITDIIKSKRVVPKDALRLLLTRLTHDNPNVQLLTLQLLDKCVKNSGKHFLVEMAGREFVDVAVSMMDDEEYGHDCNQIVQDRLIELFQEWALIFQSDPSLSYLYDTYSTLKNQKRIIFPVPSKKLDQVDPISIVSSLSPPEWSDSPTCQRCRDVFGMTNRKHHCRKCGGTFCQLCSSNEMLLLDMGISEPVRVCDSCYRAPSSVTAKRQAKVFETKQPFEETDDVELKKAIELSLKEQESKTVKPKDSDEAALKKAIETSLKDNHMTTRTVEPVKTEEPVNENPMKYFNQIELENISMFHQLIGRLVRTGPALTAEDATDLKKLAMEMRRLQKRPIESENVKMQLEESLRGYEIIFGPLENHQNRISPVQSVSVSDNGSKDLNQMRAELIGGASNATNLTNDLKQVRSRIGSLSLENQITDIARINEQQHAPLTSMYNNIPAAYHFPNNPIPVSTTAHRPTTITPVSVPIHQSPIPIVRMCPEMTIHPHPMHPFTHENPYTMKSVAIDTEHAEKKKKKKRSKSKDKESKHKKDKKETVSRITAVRENHKKNKKDSESGTKRIKKEKDSESGEKNIKKESKDKKRSESGKKRIKDDSELGKKRIKKEKDSQKKKKEKKREKRKDNKDKEDDKKTVKTEEEEDVIIVEERAKSPINLIDL